METRRREVDERVDDAVAEPPVQDGIAAAGRPGGAARCPFCHDAVDLEAPTWVACAGCLARHHGGCWGEGSRCAACGHGERLHRTSPARAAAPGETADRSPPAGAFLGEPKKLSLERVLAGEAGPEAEADLLRLLLDRYGTVGALVRAGGLLTWSPQGAPHAQARLLRVTVDANEGATRIRADEDLGGLAGGIVGGLVTLAIFGGSLLGAIASDWVPRHGPAVILGLPLLLLLPALLLARALFRAKVRERRAELRALVDDLAGRIGPSIPAARAAKKTEPGAPHA